MPGQRQAWWVSVVVSVVKAGYKVPNPGWAGRGGNNNNGKSIPRLDGMGADFYSKVR